MAATIDFASYAHALGSARAAWRFAGAELRRASAFATVSAAWDIFRRDAGAGDVGPAHESTTAQLLLTEDLRRDAVLLWLADHAGPPITEAATTLARMVGAARRFGTEELALLDTARNALAHHAKAPGSIRDVVAPGGGSNDPVLQPLRDVAVAVDWLRDDVGFLEGEGAEVSHALAGGTLSHYVNAGPAGCWALNLAQLAQRGNPADGPPPPGLVSRVAFRSDLEPDELASHLAENASAAWCGAYERLSRLEQELSRGHNALARLSRNARTRDAWLLVAALGACTRTQLARAFGLSRAGADIQARALNNAALVTLGAGGQIAWARARTRKVPAPAPLEQGPLSSAVSDLDASLAEIDRLLARTAR